MSLVRSLFLLCLGLALSKLPIHFVGISQQCIPSLPSSVSDCNRFQCWFHETAPCVFNDHCMLTLKVGWHFPCFCSLVPLHRQNCVSCVISCMVLNSLIACCSLWDWRNVHLHCPNITAKKFPIWSRWGGLACNINHPFRPRRPWFFS